MLEVQSNQPAVQNACCGEIVTPPTLEVRDLSVNAGKLPILRNVNLSIQPRQVYGLIGPSGAGKSTLLRCLNRMAELTPGLRVRGDILLDGSATSSMPADAIRQRIGMLFQQPTVFPTSILKNVLFGVSRLRKLKRSERAGVAERALREAALWDEVKDRLKLPAPRLSVGQQQRLCLARTLACDPEIILMDEPTSALDPHAAGQIEDLMARLKQTRTLVLVTHDIAQARRVCDWLACVCVMDGAGTVAETACCDLMLDRPQCQAVVDYLKHTRC